MVKCNGTEVKFRGALLAFLGDTPAAHEIGGFKIGVESVLSSR